jgi:hypothetical protein
MTLEVRHCHHSFIKCPPSPALFLSISNSLIYLCFTKRLSETLNC